MYTCLPLTWSLEPHTHLNIIRYMEHSLHLASKHFVEAVAPPSPTSVCKKVKAALLKAHNNRKLNFDEFDKVLSTINLEDQSDGDDLDGDYDSNFTPGDSLGKALALVKQVCHPVYIMIMPTDPVFRFGCPLKQECSSNHHAFRLGSNSLSFFFGFALDGRHFIIFLKDCCCYKRYYGEMLVLG